jgi:predicted homoserine dehydrogenase-like protein
MNYELLFHDLRERRIRVALTGANGGFGRTFLAQCRAAPNIELAVLCDRDVEGLRATLLQMGFAAERLRICSGEAQVRSAAGHIALIADARWLAEAPHDIVVEATGVPEVSVAIAEAALRRRVHVGMVTKETDSVVGPWLNRLALDNGVVYTTVDGDQPAGLIGLVTWARVLGFDVVCAGKASEHDFVGDGARGTVTHAGVSHAIPNLDSLWTLGADVTATLNARSQALAQFPQSATPDYCEMNVVANSTGLLPACDALHYPMCRTSELADVFVPVAEGGILTRTGVVDVFNPLRRSDEASFGGGVFVIVRCTDRAVWQLLKDKGHVVGRSGRYACIYQPFHLMGLESLTSIYSAMLHGRASGSTAQRPQAVMVARATRDLRAGETLAMGGHMHEMQGVAARLVDAKHAQDAAPYYLAADKRLLQHVPCGSAIPAAALDLEGSALARAWKQMRSDDNHREKEHK